MHHKYPISLSALLHTNNKASAALTSSVLLFDFFDLKGLLCWPSNLTDLRKAKPLQIYLHSPPSLTKKKEVQDRRLTQESSGKKRRAGESECVILSKDMLCSVC